jgi:serine protease Do
MRFAILLVLSAGLNFAQMTGGSYIGVAMQEIDHERAKALKLPEDSGVELTAIVPDSPAEKAGLKVGDVVLKYNGQRVEGNEQFARLVHETPAGREVKIEFRRGGAWQSLMVRPTRKKPDWNENMQPAPPPVFEIHVPDLMRSVIVLRSTALGIDAESIDGQLAQYFGVKEGVLVRSVMKGSAAEKAGMKAGDVILRLDDTRVGTPADLSVRLMSMHGKSAPVTLMRDHRELTVTVTIGEDAGGMIQVTPMQVHPQP